MPKCLHVVKKSYFCDVNISFTLMKAFQVIISAVALFVSTAASAQCANCTGTDSINQVVPEGMAIEVMPQYPGGEEAMMAYLIANIKYPETAKHFGAEGRVVMDFIVDIDGSLVDIKAHSCNITALDEALLSQETEARKAEIREQVALQFAKEGARVIKGMPKWTPGKRNDVAVRVKYALPIRFAIPQ